MFKDSLDFILVPQGAEYQAVWRGLSKSLNRRLPVIPIPIGCNSVTNYLQHQKLGKRGLLMGLGGSLSPQYQIGNVCIYQKCLYLNSQEELQTANYDGHFATIVHRQLKNKSALVTGLTSDRLIYNTHDKLGLGEKYHASVVDMEGYAAVEVLQEKGISLAILRIVSDGCYDTIPDLNSAITTEGKLDNLSLARIMVAQPLASVRLIKGSLTGLRQLQKVTSLLFF